MMLKAEDLNGSSLHIERIKTVAWGLMGSPSLCYKGNEVKIDVFGVIQSWGNKDKTCDKTVSP